MSAQIKRNFLQLSRLERIHGRGLCTGDLANVYFFLPKQDTGDEKWPSVTKILTSEWRVFVIVLLAVVIVSIYWLQNYSLLVNLKTHNQLLRSERITCPLL